MDYIKCPTCNRLIADKTLVYDKGMKEIYENPNIPKDKRYLEEMKLVDSLKMKNYCCKMRLITRINLIDIVK